MKNKYCITEIHFYVLRNVCCHYMSSYIMTTNISVIHILYNEKYIFMIREMFVVIIHRLV